MQVLMRVLMRDKLLCFSAMTAAIGLIAFSGSLKAQQQLPFIPKTITVKTDVITMKGQRSDLNNRSQLRLGEINKQAIRTQPIMFSGQRNKQRPSP